MGNKRVFAVGVAGRTNFTDSAIAASSAAKFSAIKNNLQVQSIPGFFREKFLYILGEQDQPIGKDALRCEKIIRTLDQTIANPTEISTDVQQRTPRQLKNFALKTAASLRHDAESNSSILEVITPDRPGLLAHLAQIFMRFELRVLNAKISTLGERVEDIFYLTDNNFEPLADNEVSTALTEAICSELDQRNEEEGQEYKLRKMKVWN